MICTHRRGSRARDEALYSRMGACLRPFLDASDGLFFDGVAAIGCSGWHVVGISRVANVLLMCCEWMSLVSLYYLAHTTGLNPQL